MCINVWKPGSGCSFIEIFKCKAFEISYYNLDFLRRPQNFCVAKCCCYFRQFGPSSSEDNVFKRHLIW